MKWKRPERENHRILLEEFGKLKSELPKNLRKALDMILKQCNQDELDTLLEIVMEAIIYDRKPDNFRFDKIQRVCLKIRTVPPIVKEDTLRKILDEAVSYNKVHDPNYVREVYEEWINQRKQLGI